MKFVEERVASTRGDPRFVGLVAATTSRPELSIFAYDASISNEAIKAAYERHPDLAHVKICILNKGIVVHIVDSPAGALGLRLVEPVEGASTAFAGRILSIFLYQFPSRAVRANQRHALLHRLSPW